MSNIMDELYYILMHAFTREYKCIFFIKIALILVLASLFGNILNTIPNLFNNPSNNYFIYNYCIIL